MTGLGDPTGKGLGVSFARRERRKAEKAPGDEKGPGDKKERDKYKDRDVKENELELLKALSKEEIDGVLLDFGLTEAEIGGISRLNKLRMIHKFGRAALKDKNMHLYAKF